MNQQLSVPALYMRTRAIVCAEYQTGWVGVNVWVFLLGQVSTEHLFTHRLLCQSEPELTGFQRNILILVLGPLQHVLKRQSSYFNLILLS